MCNLDLAIACAAFLNQGCCLAHVPIISQAQKAVKLRSSGTCAVDPSLCNTGYPIDAPIVAQLSRPDPRSTGAQMSRVCCR